jgi:ABC-type transporter MlaC component
MEAYDQYMNMFNWLNIGTITILSALIIIMYIVIAIIKHAYLKNAIKKAVKEAIKEINTEELKKHQEELENKNITEK